MSDLSAAAAALGIPEAIVQRSAAARAAETGMTVDEVLAAWAGGGSVAGASAPSEPSPAAEEAPTDSETAAEVRRVKRRPSRRKPPPSQSPPYFPARPPARPLPDPGRGDRGRGSRPPRGDHGSHRRHPGEDEPGHPPLAGRGHVDHPCFRAFALGGSATGECGEDTDSPLTSSPARWSTATAPSSPDQVPVAGAATSSPWARTSM